MVKILVFFLLIPSSTFALSFKESAYKALRSKEVWIPSLTALAFGVSKYDGRISDYASRERPIFGSKENAQDYSDKIAFYYFPLASAVSTAIAIEGKDGSKKHQRFFSYLNVLSGPVITYLFNHFLKSRSGRLRPDASNRESFPSSHTAIASAFSENVSVHSQAFAGKYTNSFNILNESLVGIVGWARIESKKHHLSDVLVGYSVGKFFTKLFHYWLIENDSSVKVGIAFEPGQSLRGTYTWEF